MSPGEWFPRHLSRKENRMENVNVNGTIPVLVAPYGPEVANCRANASGTGSAMRCRMYVAQRNKPGYLMMEVARQKTVGSRKDGVRVHPTFDWEGSICVKLGLADLAQMVMVFRGVQESALDGKGMFHRSSKADTVIRFSHQIEPRPGYLLDISTKPSGGELKKGYYFFSPEEAVWFSVALEGVLPQLAFGVPREVPVIDS